MKPKNSKSAPPQTVKMALTPAPSETSHMANRALKANIQSPVLSSINDFELENVDTSQDEMAPPTTLKQIDKMFKKSLKYTSDYITTSLTKEIRDLGQRMSALEIRVDDVENCTLNYSTEIDNLKEENTILQTRLEDYENHPGN